MRQRKFAVICVFVMIGFLSPFNVISQTIVLPDSISTEIYDTVYIAPDTIKSVRIDTVFEYIEEAQTPRVIKKRPNLAMMFEPQFGIGISKMYPMYNKIAVNGLGGFGMSFMYNNLFANISILANTVEENQIAYSRHYTNYRHWTDTIKTVIDEYTEIIGKDTIRTQVIKKTFIPKTDTLNSDSTFSNKNRYWNLQIPLLFGYNFKFNKTWIGVAVGPSLRLLFANTSNKVIVGDTTFVDESLYFKKITIDLSGKVFVKQKLTKKLWTTGTVFVDYDLRSNFQNYTTNLYRSNVCFTFGLEYFFNL